MTLADAVQVALVHLHSNGSAEDHLAAACLGDLLGILLPPAEHAVAMQQLDAAVRS